MELMLDSNSSNRVVTLFGDIDKESIQPIVEELLNINKEDEGLDPEHRTPINLYISSHGGEVAPATALVSTIESIDTPVYTHAIGEVMSSALLIFVVGDKRYGYKHSDFMYHSISGVSAGSIKRTKHYTKKLEDSQRGYDEIILTYTKFTEDKLKEIVESDEDYYFNYLEAYELGVCDYIEVPEVYTKDCEYIKNTYPEPEVIEIDDKAILDTIPREELLKLYNKYTGV